MLGEYSFLAEGEVLDADEGRIFGTGLNFQGELGVNTTTASYNTVQQEFHDDVGWKSVACGRYHVMAIRTDGTLWATGFNTNGQLGLGDISQRIQFTQVGVATDWETVACGRSHSLVINSAGTMYSCGSNSNGQLGLGIGTVGNDYRSLQFVGSGYAKVAAGNLHTMSIKIDGTLWATGYNFQGQLGINTTGAGTDVSSFTPTYGTTDSGGGVGVPVTGENKWTAVSCGANFSTALLEDGGVGTLWGTGINSSNCWAEGATIEPYYFQRSNNESNYSAMSNGSFFTMTIRQDGTIYGIGDNTNGQLGRGNNNDHIIYSQESTFSNNWVFVSCGAFFSIAIKADGSMWGTGLNSSGQLGQGDNGDENRFQPIGSDFNWESVSCGEASTLAVEGLRASGTV